MRRGLSFTLTVALLLPLAALAQSFEGLGDFGTPFTLSITPEHPAPYGQVSISTVSSFLDLANATVVVTSSGKRIYEGSVQPVSIALGGAGSVTRVEVAITAGGATYRETLSIRPQDVVLVAEPVSSAPPLYPGKPLPPLGGDVRVVAVANLRNASGTALDPSTLSYAWTVEGARIANSSGIGKSAILVASPMQYRARDVSVAVASRDGSLVGGDTISLSSWEPSVRLYENDPLLGIRFDRALGNSYRVASVEATLYAAPFSLPTTGGAPLLQWFLNGSPVQTGNSITLRPTGSGKGSASLSLTASSGGLATASANLSLSFGSEPGGGFFGL